MSISRAKRRLAKSIRYMARCDRHERAEERALENARRHAEKAQHFYDVAVRYRDLATENLQP